MTNLEALQTLAAHRCRTSDPVNFVKATFHLFQAMKDLPASTEDIRLLPIKRPGPKPTPKFCTTCGAECPSLRAARIHCSKPKEEVQ